MKTIETNVQETILEKPEPLTIGKKTYQLPPITTATLIQISALISLLPQRMPADDDGILEFVLSRASECGSLGDIAATLVIGVTKTKKEQNSLISKIVNKIKGIPTIEELAEQILVTKSPSQINEIISTRLKRLEIADFFAVTTSLIEVNLLRATKEVVTKTTASGH